MRRCLSILILVASLAVSGQTVAVNLAAAASGSGPTACTSGNPPAAFKGFCGTYGGINTWYGSYGPGFPGTLGWVLCANRPTNSGSYPSPTYAYVPTAAPSGIRTAGNSALGFAFSEASALGWVAHGLSGQFSANEVGAAMRLLATQQWWSSPAVIMEPGLSRAYVALKGLFTTATGSTGAAVTSLGITSGDTSITTSATIGGRITFPGSGRALSGVSVQLSVHGATFSTLGGRTTLTIVTNASGSFSVVVVNPGGPVHPITVSVVATVGQRGISYVGPTLHVANAQIVGAATSPTVIARALSVNSGLQTGFIDLLKTGDDSTYLPLTGAVFEIQDSNGLAVGTLTTDVTGHAGPSDPLPLGIYTVHEVLPPWGYLPSPDQSVVVTSGATTTVNLSGVLTELVIRASLGLTKVDGTTGAVLAGATFHLEYDADRSGTFALDLGLCITAADGFCPSPGYGQLLPGDYRITETSPPPNYHLPSVPTVFATLVPGEVRLIVFSDESVLTQLVVSKRNASQPGVGVPGAIYDLYSVNPGPAGGPLSPPPTSARVIVGSTWYARGTTDVAGHLTFIVPSGTTWCVLEHQTPPGFVLDPAIRCSAGPLIGSVVPLVIDEREHLVTFTMQKYNSATPGTGVPNATFDLFIKGSVPPGYDGPPLPLHVALPSGYAYFGGGSTNASGILSFRVPASETWCVRERSAPLGYVLDPALHCTNGPLSIDPGPTAITMAIPELPSSPELPMTGLDVSALVFGSLTLFGLGASALFLGRRRRQVG